MIEYSPIKTTGGTWIETPEKYRHNKKGLINIKVDDNYCFAHNMYLSKNMKNIPFIIGIQTPWMQEMMVKHSHNSIIAMDSTFSTNKNAISK